MFSLTSNYGNTVKFNDWIKRYYQDLEQLYDIFVYYFQDFLEIAELAFREDIKYDFFQFIYNNTQN